MPSRAMRTEENDSVFFTALENGHSVSAACAASGYTRQVVYRWRKDPTFDARWRAVTAMGGDLLEEEADRRGRVGYEQPVYYRGQEVGAKRKFSDGLLLARLKALRPELYRDRRSGHNDETRPLKVLIRDFALEDFITGLVEAGRVSLDEVPERLRAHIRSKTEGPKEGAIPHLPDSISVGGSTLLIQSNG